VGVDRLVSLGPGQVLVLSVGDVLLRLRVSVFFLEAEIYDMDHILFFTQAYQEVIRLDIPVEKVLRVHIFDPIDHLILQHDHSLE